MANECVKRPANCGNLALGCVAVIPWDEVEDHMARLCVKRMVSCRLECGLVFPYDSRSAHEVGEVSGDSAGFHGVTVLMLLLLCVCRALCVGGAFASATLSA